MIWTQLKCEGWPGSKKKHADILVANITYTYLMMEHLKSLIKIFCNVYLIQSYVNLIYYNVSFFQKPVENIKT